MKAVIAATEHWLDGDSIREKLVQLPVSSTVVISDRHGGDKLVAKIAQDEMALHVEKILVESANFRQKMIQEIDDETDAAIFFCSSESDEEYLISKYARTHRVPTEVVIKSMV